MCLMLLWTEFLLISPIRIRNSRWSFLKIRGRMQNLKLDITNKIIKKWNLLRIEGIWFGKLIIINVNSNFYV